MSNDQLGRAVEEEVAITNRFVSSSQRRVQAAERLWSSATVTRAGGYSEQLQRSSRVRLSTYRKA